MMRALLPITIAITLVAPAPAFADTLLFASRVPYDPLLKKLAAAGQSRDKILHVEAGRDLLRLKSGQRYKLIVDGTGKIAIAPLPADAPGNEYVHPILAGGAPVATAGGITVEHAGGAISRITLDQDSKAYCPTFASLQAATQALSKLGLAPALINHVDKAPACAAKP